MHVREEFDAVFEHGVFRPLDAKVIGMREGERVKLIVDHDTGSNEDALDVLTHVLDGLTEADVDSIVSIALDRTNFMRDEGDTSDG